MVDFGSAGKTLQYTSNIKDVVAKHTDVLRNSVQPLCPVFVVCPLQGSLQLPCRDMSPNWKIGKEAVGKEPKSVQVRPQGNPSGNALQGIQHVITCCGCGSSRCDLMFVTDLWLMGVLMGIS